jgi:ankyrin repeat protein
MSLLFEILKDLKIVDVKADSKDIDGGTSLLATGKVDADSKDTRYGQTPLSWAAEKGHETVVKLLQSQNNFSLVTYISAQSPRNPPPAVN